MQDRIPLYPGRIKLTPVAGQENIYDMVRADQPIQEGTPLNKANLLSDEVAEEMKLPDGSWTPNCAFSLLNSRVGAITYGKAIVNLTVTLPNADPAIGMSVSGLTDASGATVTTDANGKATGLVPEGASTLTISSQYIDIVPKTVNVTTVAGEIYNTSVQLEYETSVKITTSKTVMFSEAVSGKAVAVKCVGGGGAGGASWSFANGYCTSAGGGGGGGYIETGTIYPVAGETYQAVIGSGGTTVSVSPGDGNDGGNTSFAGITASGGKGGKGGIDHYGSGGEGGPGTGSGGKGGDYSYKTNNGENGGDGIEGYGGGGGGGGSYYYGEYTGTGGTGGAGGGGNAGKAGTNGTGGGGGGGGRDVSQSSASAQKGGSGAIIITFS